MSIGQRIYEYRKEMNVSQEPLGEMLGVSRQAVYKWESGQSLPDTANLIELGKIFKVSLSELLGEEKEVIAASKERSKKNKKVPWLTIILVLLILFQGFIIISLEDRMRKKDQMINHLSSFWNVPIDNVKNEDIEDIDFKLITIDFETMEIEYSISVTLRREYEDTKVSLVVNDKTYPISQTNGKYEDIIKVPFDFKQDVYFEFKSNGATEKIYFDRGEDPILRHIYAPYVTLREYGKNKITITTSFSFDPYSLSDGESNITGMMNIIHDPEKGIIEPEDLYTISNLKATFFNDDGEVMSAKYQLFDQYNSKKVKYEFKDVYDSGNLKENQAYIFKISYVINETILVEIDIGKLDQNGELILHSDGDTNPVQERITFTQLN